MLLSPLVEEACPCPHRGRAQSLHRLHPAALLSMLSAGSLRRVPTGDAASQVPRDCPEDIVDLIHECTQQNPALRPDMKQCFDRIKARLVRRKCTAAIRLCRVCHRRRRRRSTASQQ